MLRRPLGRVNPRSRRRLRIWFTTAVRGITHAIRAERGPFKNITPGGRHIHHMTFGITGLLTVGYLWLLEIGVAEDRRSSRVTSLVYDGDRLVDVLYSEPALS